MLTIDWLHVSYVKVVITIKRSKKESGQTLVEFALIVPILLLLIFVALDFGIAYHRYHVITGAAREGARAGAVHKTDIEIETRVDNALISIKNIDTVVDLKDKAYYDANDPGVNNIFLTIEQYNEAGPLSDKIVEVRVKCAVKTIVPLLNIFFEDGIIVLENEAKMKLE